MPQEPSHLDFEVLETSTLDPRRRALLLGLFESNYLDANPRFVDRSLAALGSVALAYDRGEAVGFALGEARTMDLPRLPEQGVILAGLCCIDPAFRRRGLFGELTRLATDWDPEAETARRLFCGRVAHPAAYRTIAHLAGTIPRPGVPLTSWQQEIGRAIAATYRVHDFDPESFVCIGEGRPTGVPRIDFEVEPSEWEVFAAVDRNRGDALLALGWFPDAPPGW